MNTNVFSLCQFLSLHSQFITHTHTWHTIHSMSMAINHSLDIL